MIFGKVMMVNAVTIIIFLLNLQPAWAEWIQSGDLFALLEKKYGFMDLASDPKLAQIQNIFNRVQDAADKRGNRMPQLKVVNQPEHPWAMALPDGTILLSLGAIHLCYRNVSQNEGDTRMAFVLGHELAHLTKNDFWDTDLYQAIAGSVKPAKTVPQPKADKTEKINPHKKQTLLTKETEKINPHEKQTLLTQETEKINPHEKQTPLTKETEKTDPHKTPLTQETEKTDPHKTPLTQETEKIDLHEKQTILQKEAEADDLGFLYAAISGYPVQILLSRTDKPEDNFFFLWTSQAKGYNALHDSHPSPEDRLAFLRTRLDQLTEAILFFRFGLRLAYFGHCEQAIALFRHFLQVFPAREVFNNLGACHLQRAQKRMEASKAAAALYWFPVLFEPFSRAEILITGHPFRTHDDPPSLLPVLSDTNGHDLEQAVEYLEQAAHADAAYVPARLNLATAYFYGGELLKARGAMKDAMRIAPKHRDVAGWHALLLFLDSQENGLGEAALPPLTRLANQADAPASLIYNHAILTKALGKKGKSPWRRLATLPTPLSAGYAKKACEVAQILCATVQSTKEKNFPWPVPVQPGTDLQTVNQDKLFAGWQVSQLGWLLKKQQGTVHRRGEEMEVLDQDGYVTMVVLRGGILGSTKVVKKKVGNPIHVRPLADGEVWSYGPRWSLLVRDGLVREAWVVGKGP